MIIIGFHLQHYIYLLIRSCNTSHSGQFELTTILSGDKTNKHSTFALCGGFTAGCDENCIRHTHTFYVFLL